MEKIFRNPHDAKIERWLCDPVTSKEFATNDYCLLGNYIDDNGLVYSTNVEMFDDGSIRICTTDNINEVNDEEVWLEPGEFRKLQMYVQWMEKTKRTEREQESKRLNASNQEYISHMAELFKRK